MKMSINDKMHRRSGKRVACKFISIAMACFLLAGFCSVYATGELTKNDTDAAGGAVILLNAGENITFSGGDGTENNPYLISNVDDLQKLANVVNSSAEDDNGVSYSAAFYVLTNNIELNPSLSIIDGSLASDVDELTVWSPIGSASSPFTGTFDGQGNTVSGMYIPDGTSQYSGLFGYAGTTATITRLCVANSWIEGSLNSAAICAYSAGIIRECSSISSIIMGKQSAGGVCLGGNPVELCYNASTVSGPRVVGGICGDAKTVSNCYNTGSVLGTSSSAVVGGICGQIGSGSTVKNCYNVGSVSGEGTKGEIYGGWYSASISGSAYDALIQNCYFDENISVNGQFETPRNMVVGKCSMEQFASGEICWLLNENGDTGVWKQSVGVDAYPSFAGNVLYCHYNSCVDGDRTLTNDSSLENSIPAHVFENGACTTCGMFEAITPIRNGSGVYEIYSAGELFGFANLVNGGNKSISAKLMNDIVINTVSVSTMHSWTPIGTEDHPYSGTFDGQGFTVSGLHINAEMTCVGMFGYLSGGTVKNLCVEDSYIRGTEYVGGICGYARNGSIQACSYSGTVIGNANVGGICGYYRVPGSLYECYNNAQIIGGANVGGICGQRIGPIRYSHNCGEIYGQFQVGGIVGFIDSTNSSYSNVAENCSNKGDVAATTRVGGICGLQWCGVITKCWNDGEISGSETIGGIAGYSGYNARIQNAYNSGAIYGNKNVGGIVGSGGQDPLYVYNTGMVTCDGHYGGSIFGYATHARGNMEEYSLEGTCHRTGYNYMTGCNGTIISAEKFASGELAYKFQEPSSQPVNTWFQTIGVDPSPVIDTTHEEVYKLTFVMNENATDTTVYTVGYSNCTPITLPTPPQHSSDPEHLAFGYWSFTSESGSTALSDSSAVTEDTTLYAHWLPNISLAHISVLNPTYCGTAVTPEITATLNGEELVEGVDYTVSFLFDGNQIEEKINAGVYAAVVSGTGNYAGTTTIDFQILKAGNSITGLLCEDVFYGGTPQPSGATAQFGEISYLYSDSHDGQYGPWDTENCVGTWYVKATVNETSNYSSAEMIVDFAVKKTNQATLSIDSISAKTYGDEAFHLNTIGGSGTGDVTFVSSNPAVLTFEGNLASIHGSGAVTITATKSSDTNHHSANASVTIAILPKKLYVSADDYTIARGWEAPEFTYTVSGFVGDDVFVVDPAITTSGDRNVAGNYEISISGGVLAVPSNYDIVYTSGILSVVEPTASLDSCHWDGQHTLMTLDVMPSTLLSHCNAVYAARYENGKMQEIVSGVITNNGLTISFNSNLTEQLGWKIFFLQNNLCPVCNYLPLN